MKKKPTKKPVVESHNNSSIITPLCWMTLAFNVVWNIHRLRKELDTLILATAKLIKKYDKLKVVYDTLLMEEDDFK